MFRKLISVAVLHGTKVERAFSQSLKQKERWDLLASVLIERLPIISKEFTPFEKEYSEMLTKIEFEKSMKSNHEIRNEKDIIQAERLKKGDGEIELDDTLKQTAQDLEDAYKEEFKKFEFAPRLTQDDKTKNLLSSNRQLDETLLLLLDQQIGNKKFLLLPQGRWNGGETLRETAERVFKEKFGETLAVKFYGNAPIGFYKYKYPISQRKEAVGAKVFFFRAVLSGQGAKVPEKAGKIEWLSKSELDSKLNPDYLRAIKQFIL